MLEDHSCISTTNALTPIYPKKIQVTLSEENRPPPKHLSKLVNKKTFLNLNIASYFLNILASPNLLTWFNTHLHNQKTIEERGTWLIGVKKRSKSTQGGIVQGTLVNLTF